MRLIDITALLGATALVAACAQQPEPMTINPEPMHDKFGGGSCVAGYTYVPGAGVESDQCIPDDECAPSTSSAAPTPCLPPPGRGRDSSTTSSGRTPSGSTPGTPGTAP